MNFNKPVFRWIVGGNSLPRSKFLLKKSVESIFKIYEDTFDYVLSCNDDFEYYYEFAKKYNIFFHKQEWTNEYSHWQKPLKANQLFNTRIISGSIWKLCPPRINKAGCEIVCDNDIVLIKRCEKIDLFLKTKDRPFILEDPDPYYGAYNFHPYKKVFFNSGFYGLHPNFDFDSEIKYIWSRVGAYEMNYDDEQGLITSVLSNQKKFYLITKKEMPILLSEYVSTKCLMPMIHGIEPYSFDLWHNFKSAVGFHFAGANRRKVHRFWQSFSIKNL